MARFLWTQKQDMGPPARAGHAMTYDSVRGRSVLFGGDSLKPQLFNDTWEWDGALWTQMANFGPPARCDHSMAYDAARRQAVVFGGSGAGGTFLGDTWGWNGEDWTQLADSGPPNRSGHGAAYESVTRRIVIFGGISDGQLLGDTWEWVGQDWTQVAETGPAPRKGLVMAYDTDRSKTVLFGGAGADGVGIGDTWEWDGTAWTRAADFGATACLNGAMVFAADHSALFGGIDSINSSPPPHVFGTSWEWDGKHWALRQDMGPGPRWRHAMAFDDQRAAIVLFGGLSASQQGGAAPAPLGDTWEHASVASGSLVLARMTMDPPVLVMNQQSKVTVTVSGSAEITTPPVVISVIPAGVIVVVANGDSLPLPFEVFVPVGGNTAQPFQIAPVTSVLDGVVLKADFNGTSRTLSFPIMPS